MGMALRRSFEPVSGLQPAIHVNHPRHVSFLQTWSREHEGPHLVQAK